MGGVGWTEDWSTSQIGSMGADLALSGGVQREQQGQERDLLDRSCQQVRPPPPKSEP